MNEKPTLCDVACGVVFLTLLACLMVLMLAM